MHAYEEARNHMKYKQTLLIAWLLIIVFAVLLFDLHIVTHQGLGIFEDGSFIVGNITGCLPNNLCN